MRHCFFFLFFFICRVRKHGKKLFAAHNFCHVTSHFYFHFSQVYSSMCHVPNDIFFIARFAKKIHSLKLHLFDGEMFSY